MVNLSKLYKIIPNRLVPVAIFISAVQKVKFLSIISLKIKIMTLNSDGIVFDWCDEMELKNFELSS